MLQQQTQLRSRHGSSHEHRDDRLVVADRLQQMRPSLAGTLASADTDADAKLEQAANARALPAVRRFGQAFADRVHRVAATDARKSRLSIWQAAFGTVIAALAIALLVSIVSGGKPAPSPASEPAPLTRIVRVIPITQPLPPPTIQQVVPVPALAPLQAAREEAPHIDEPPLTAPRQRVEPTAKPAPRDICARTGGRKITIGRGWRCVYTR